MRYIVNSETKQIHDKQTREERCNLEGYKERANFNEMEIRDVMNLLREGFDTCDYCFADASAV